MVEPYGRLPRKRRAFLRGLYLVGTGAITTACALSSTASAQRGTPSLTTSTAALPTPAPTAPLSANPTAASSGAADTDMGIPRPIATATVSIGRAASTPTREAGWAREWDDLVAAATAEGILSLLTVVGNGYLTAIRRFEEAFPGIAVRHLAESSASVWFSRVWQERQAGTYAFDVALVSPDRVLVEGRSADFWAPLKPLLLRPDVLNASVWRDGPDARYLDSDGVLCFDWEYQVIHAYAVNTDIVADGEITEVEHLLDSKWRGRMASLDPRLGTGLLSAASIARKLDSDMLRRLLVDQRPTIYLTGPDEIAEVLARGRCAIALGVRLKALNPLRERGLGHNVRYLDLPDADFVATNCLWRFDRAPHPAAARLFANWMLTQETQSMLCEGLQTNSARTDVSVFESDGVGASGAGYYEQDREANYAHTASTKRLVDSLLRGV